MAKAVKNVILKKGRMIMAHPQKARVFSSIGNANNFIKNLCRVSKSLKPADFELVRFDS
jgi:hypothetical protein